MKKRRSIHRYAFFFFPKGDYYATPLDIQLRHYNILNRQIYRHDPGGNYLSRPGQQFCRPAISRRKRQKPSYQKNTWNHGDGKQQYR